jgi:nucleotide-binding universal stress UspA family protein
MKILVAVDPSQHSREAIQFVKSVDWPKQSIIYLIHVIELKHAPPILPSGGPSSWDRVIAEARGKLLTEAKIFLEQTKKDILQEQSYTIHTFVVEGLPGAELLQAVENYQIDFIILGTRGLSNVKRFFLGSTSEWVMRDAPCSVLLVRGKLSQSLTGKRPAKVLLATDGSSGAWDMVHMLSLLKCRTSPKVTVAHVVGRPTYLEGWYFGKGKAELKKLADQLLEKEEKDGVNHLEEISQRIKAFNKNVNTLLTKGDPADEIITTAERIKAKLIVVGSKETSQGHPIPLGGVVKKIYRHAPCSVLLFRNGRPKQEI